MITSKTDTRAYFTVVEESEHSRTHTHGNGTTGFIITLPLNPKVLTLYTFEPEEMPEIELKPVNFNDLFGG